MDIEGGILVAILRVCERNGNRRFSRRELIHTEIDAIAKEVGSTYENAITSLGFSLSALVRLGWIKRIGHGEYEFQQPWYRVYRKVFDDLQRGK